MEMLSKLQKLLLKIPKGKVTTYAEIARKLKIHPRHAGLLLSKNKDTKKYPCYRVVCSDGIIGGYSGPGGSRAKEEKLKKDGISMSGGKVDLAGHRFSFK